MPGFVTRMLFGEAADALLLASARVLPTRLRETGFQFEHPDLELALRELLER
jgi:NAD dependent epimerase/dehydratase family enzyme